ncbi:MAG: hypothetical protein QMD94_00795 [Candidatus Omnitrophota bacterium]|nr:hypothetical protein [Candidatus Omnitrophota bacterium]
MTKKRVEIIIIGALILIFIFTWGNTFKIIKKRAGPTFPHFAESAVGVIGGVNQKAALFLDKPAIGIGASNKLTGSDNAKADSVWGRCPFSGETYFCDEEVIGLRLVGIIWDKKGSLAIINNDIVKIGDKIGAVTVVDIKQDRVILNDGSRNIELILRE